MLHRRTATKRLVTDGRLLDEIEQLRETLRLAKTAEKFRSQGLADESPRLERQLDELVERAAEEAILITVQALPGEEFDEIARRHPPSSEQLERWREQAKAFALIDMPEWNDRTMGPELLTACLVEPKWSADEVEKFWKSLSRGGQNQLWNLALSVQVSGTDLPFFNAATASTNGGGDKSTSSVSVDSLSQSS